MEKRIRRERKKYLWNGKLNKTGRNIYNKIEKTGQNITNHIEKNGAKEILLKREEGIYV